MKNKYNDEIEVMVLIAEDASKGPATLGYCKQWAIAHGDPDGKYTYLDISGGVSWNNTFSNIENYGNGGIGLPWSAVLDASSMEYKWCDYAGEGTLDSNIQALLGQ